MHIVPAQTRVQIVRLHSSPVKASELDRHLRELTPPAELEKHHGTIVAVNGRPTVIIDSTDLVVVGAVMDAITQAGWLVLNTVQSNMVAFLRSAVENSWGSGFRLRRMLTALLIDEARHQAVFADPHVFETREQMDAILSRATSVITLMALLASVKRKSSTDDLPTEFTSHIYGCASCWVGVQPEVHSFIRG